MPWRLVSVALTTDTVTRDYLDGMGPVIRESALQRACHLLPWSCDGHMTLDDPRWEELPQCVVPPLKVYMCEKEEEGG